MNSSMKKYVKALLNIVIAVVGLLLIVWLVPKGIVFFMPFVIGWVIACIASPVVKFFEEKLKIKRKAGSAFVVIVVIGLVILCLYLVGGKLLREVMGFVQDLPDMWKSLTSDFADIEENMSVVLEKLPEDVQENMDKIGKQANELAMGLISRFSSPAIAAVGNFATQLPTMVIGVVMCLLSAYFFVAERGKWSGAVYSMMPKGLLNRWMMIKDCMLKAVGGYFKAQIKIEVWIYLLLVIGLMVLGVNYTLLVAFGIAVLDFLPFFGTGTVMVPWAIFKFLSADYKMTIGLLIIWGVGQLVRQIIQPKIMGDSMGMPPVPTLFLLYIGYMLGGVIGMILAVPIGIIVVTMYREGAFRTTQQSVQILAAGINHFRRLNKQDLEVIELYRKECEEDTKKNEEL